MPLIGFIVAIVLLSQVRRHLLRTWGRRRALGTEPPRPRHGCGPASWHDAWQREWGEKFRQQAERRERDVARHALRVQRHWEREARRWARRAQQWGIDVSRWPQARPGWPWGMGNGPHAERRGAAAGADTVTGGEDAPARAGAGPGGAAPAETPGANAAMPSPATAMADVNAEIGFQVHLMSYLGVMALLAFINLMTTPYPWFIWPALGWGLGVFSHYVGVFGLELVHRRYVEPVVEREVRREKAAMTSEKQASIDELSSTLAHEIRNPVAAAKSLVQQMGEDPTSLENVEYAKVALEELDRVERSIAHLLKYAREEDYQFAPVNVAGVLDAALTEMRAKLDGAKVAVARNYIGGPTIVADGEKLRRVFANILDNAIDALAGAADGRRIDCFIQNGGSGATVRLRDNGCGIPPDKIDRIFNPFFTTKEHGTGLGMAISKKIVEAHEGSIDVLSEPGRGTEFVVTLPMPH